jgi:hypothetical protein
MRTGRGSGFIRNTATMPIPCGFLALFKAQHESECYGCRMMKSHCAIAVVAASRFKRPLVADSG